MYLSGILDTQIRKNSVKAREDKKFAEKRKISCNRKNKKCKRSARSIKFRKAILLK